MTGIQALEHKYPDKLPLPGQCAKIEFKYIRHGTTSLISFFDVATGRMEAPYLNATYRRGFCKIREKPGKYRPYSVPDICLRRAEHP